jgi:hypothetical protein
VAGHKDHFPHGLGHAHRLRKITSGNGVGLRLRVTLGYCRYWGVGL